MGLSYTPGKGWNVSYEKTDYKNDYNTNLPVSFYIEFDDKKDVRRKLGGKQRRTQLGIEQGYTIYKVYPDGTTDVDKSGTFRTFGLVSDNNEKYEKFKRNINQEVLDKKEQGKKNAKTNERNQELNDIANTAIAKNTALNNSYNAVINVANGTKGNDYLGQRGTIEKSLESYGVDSSVVDNLKSQFKLFYLTEKLQPWSENLAKDPPYGEFKPRWYLDQYKDISDAWAKAQELDNIDITERFKTDTTWAKYHYTNFGSKPSENRRGNPAEEDAKTLSYLEPKLTDAQLQDLRDKTLGISPDIGQQMTEYVKNTPSLSNAWESAKKGDSYWKNLAKQNYLDINDPNDFYYLFSLSNRPQDVAAREKLQQEGSLFISDVEDAILTAAGNKSLTEVKKFGALTQNVLQDTIQEIKEQKIQEQNLNLYKGLPGFEEIFGLSSTLSESILGDSGVGGYLGMMGGGEYKDSLERSIAQAAGIGLSSNSVIYNWEKWFTDQLAESYIKGYRDLYDKELSKLNILNAALPKAEDFNAYVNANQNVLDAYDAEIRGKTGDQIPSRAEFGRKHWVETGSKNPGSYDTSMFKDPKSFYDPKTGLFSEEFLYDAYYNTTGEIVNFLNSLDDAEAEDLLSTITNGSLGEGSVLSDLESLKTNIQNRMEGYNNQTSRDITLDWSIDDEPQQALLVETEFVQDFVQDYLKPRFDYSRSMDEFVEYMDVRQEEQNPFQTQNILDALKLTAEARSKNLINEANNVDRAFTVDFYMNPISQLGDAAQDLTDARRQEYENQAAVVGNDWERAKIAEARRRNGQDPGEEDWIDPSNKSLGKWTEQAYRYGFDINKKEHFARLHNEAKGSFEGYNFDGARDNYTRGEINSKIYREIFPELLNEAEGMSGVFGEFITPEEFAYEALKGVERFSDEEYNELLKSFGLSDFQGTIDELREVLQDALRGGAALDIREGIKYLNEKREKPTQEKLGITYIQREADYETGEYPGETQLYKMFQSAGYAGNEDQFYEEFFPDVDRKEQILLTQAGGGKSFDLEFPDLNDPYAALSSLSNLFPEDEDASLLEEKEEKPKTSFFTVGLDEDLSKKYKQDEEPLTDLTTFLQF